MVRELDCAFADEFGRTTVDFGVIEGANLEILPFSRPFAELGDRNGDHDAVVWHWTTMASLSAKVILASA